MWGVREVSLPWTDFELQVLYDHINDIEWFPPVRRLIRDRSDGAIRTKMDGLREFARIRPSRSLSASDKAVMLSETGSDRLAMAINALREKEAA
jgi:hypothetical protein